MMSKNLISRCLITLLAFILLCSTNSAAAAVTHTPTKQHRHHGTTTTKSTKKSSTHTTKTKKSTTKPLAKTTKSKTKPLAPTKPAMAKTTKHKTKPTTPAAKTTPAIVKTTKPVAPVTVTVPVGKPVVATPRPIPAPVPVSTGGPSPAISGPVNAGPQPIAAPPPVAVVPSTGAPVATTPSSANPIAQTPAPISMAHSASMQQNIDNILSKFPNLNVGVIIESSNNGAVLYQHNGNQTFIPASTLKTFTAAAALSYLGPDYILRTQFLTNTNSIQNGVLNGNLYARFAGDADLTVNDLNSMIAALVSKGIHEVQGSLIIDDHALDQSNWAPGSMWQDEILCYAAPATSIILNRNCFGLSIGPGPLNGLANVRISPTYANISIFNQTKTTSRNTCPLNLVELSHNTYELSGCIAAHHPGISDAVAINNSRQAGTDILLGLLKKHNITINGGVYYAVAPNNTNILVEHDSDPLGKVITHMLKKSDDLVTDALYKKLASVYFNTTGTWANGKQALSSILSPHTGLNFNQMVIVDGSGLSRNNQISPAQLAALLNYAYQSMPNGDVFYQALPISGVDGTLRFRLGGDTQGRIHAKTGTMKNVSGLAGYVRTVNNKSLTFAILINATNGNQGTYHMLQDRICRYLAVNSW